MVPSADWRDERKLPAIRRNAGDRMLSCKECGDEVEEVVRVKIGGRVRKLCEDCADRKREEAEVAEESEAVVQ